MKKNIVVCILFLITIYTTFADNLADLLQDLAIQTACLGMYSSREAGARDNITNRYIDPPDWYTPPMMAERFARMSGTMTRTITFYGVCFDYAQFAWDDIKRYQETYNNAGMKGSQWFIASTNHNDPNTIYLYDPVSQDKATMILNGIPVREHSRHRVRAHDDATGHAWLWVQHKNGTWYWIDPTWTDNTGYPWWGIVDNGREVQLFPSPEYSIASNYPRPHRPDETPAERETRRPDSTYITHEESQIRIWLSSARRNTYTTGFFYQWDENVSIYGLEFAFHRSPLPFLTFGLELRAGGYDTAFNQKLIRDEIPKHLYLSASPTVGFVLPITSNLKLYSDVILELGSFGGSLNGIFFDWATPAFDAGISIIDIFNIKYRGTLYSDNIFTHSIIAGLSIDFNPSFSRSNTSNRSRTRKTDHEYFFGYNYMPEMPVGFTIGFSNFYFSINTNIFGVDNIDGAGNPKGSHSGGGYSYAYDGYVYSFTGDTMNYGFDCMIGYTVEIIKGFIRLPIGIGLGWAQKLYHYDSYDYNYTYGFPPPNTRVYEEGWYGIDDDPNFKFIAEAGLQIILFDYFYLMGTYRLKDFKDGGFTIGGGFIF